MTLLCCILLFGLLQVTHATVRGDVNDVSFANFIVHEGSKLCGSPLKKVNLKSLFDCLIECTANTRCLSTNVNTTSDAQGLLECELLGIDKYQHENNSVTKVKGIDHYALPSKCSSNPCKHNAKCISEYATNSYHCQCLPGTKGNHCQTEEFRNCAQRFTAGYTTSDVYAITLLDNTTTVQVYCDMVTSGGGWTVIQKRLDGSVDFYRGWTDYKAGFGNKHGEYWLGLDTIHAMTSQEGYRLRVDLEDLEGNTRYAEYDSFMVSDEADKYRLIVGNYSGNAGDSLAAHSSYRFTTKDNDNDADSKVNCAVRYTGAWWYKACHFSNLNGHYLNGTNDQHAKGVVWYHWKGHNYSLKRAEMKIRPRHF